MNGKTFLDKESDRLETQYGSESIPEWEQKSFDDIEKVMDAFKVIVDYGNVMGRKPQQAAEIIGDVLETSHRTLQQGAMSSLINVIVNYADARSDGRNEYSVKACKAIKKALEEEGFLYKDAYSAPFI